MHTQSNQQAQLAFKHVSKLVGGTDAAKYRSMVLKLPALIQMSGLAPALHFVAARSEQGQRRILKHLAEQLLGEAGTPDALLTDLRGADFSKTRAQTRQVQRALTWYKRFCQSLLRDQEEASCDA